jgi:hypothetical protein
VKSYDWFNEEGVDSLLRHHRSGLTGLSTAIGMRLTGLSNTFPKRKEAEEASDIGWKIIGTYQKHNKKRADTKV